MVFNRREELRAVMRNYFERNQTVTRKQIIKNLISDYFGSFHSKDYRAIFKEFIDSGILTTTDMKTKIDNRSYNYSTMGK
jgi:hypothetical protein